MVGGVAETDGMEAVADLLDRFRLAAYVEAFDEKGYDDLAWLLQMDGNRSSRPPSPMQKLALPRR